MTKHEYYHVRHDDVPDTYRLEIKEGSPVWGYSPYYMTDTEIHRLNKGLFRPELVQHTWNKSFGSFEVDFSYVGGEGVLTVADSLYASFETILTPYVVTFPAKIDNQKYTSFRPNSFFDLLDRDKSIYRITTKGNLLHPKKIVLSDAPQDKIPIFGIRFNGEDKPFLIVSDEFKSVYEERKCTGLRFFKAWPLYH